MIINETQKYILFHIPKNGGTSIRSGHKKQNQHHIIKDYYKEPTKTEPDLAHLNLYNFQRHVKLQHPISSYAMYTVVRNPIERFLSGWNELHKHNISKHYLRKILNVVTIQEFINAIFQDQSHILKNELIWVSPQHLYCEHVDFSNKVNIIQFNQLAIRCKALFNLDIPHINLNKSPKISISDEYIDKLKTIYKHDFELLNNLNNDS